MTISKNGGQTFCGTYIGESKEETPEFFGFSTVDHEVALLSLSWDESILNMEEVGFSPDSNMAYHKT
jgi:hypothetical protein